MKTVRSPEEEKATQNPLRSSASRSRFVERSTCKLQVWCAQSTRSQSFVIEKPKLSQWLHLHRQRRRKQKNVENVTVGIAQTARFSKRQSTQRGDMISVSQVPPLHRRVSAVATDWEDLREVLLPIAM